MTRIFVFVVLHLLGSALLNAQDATADEIVCNLENASVRRYLDAAATSYSDVYTHSTIVSRYVSGDPNARDDMGAEAVIKLPEYYSRPFLLTCRVGNYDGETVFSKTIDTDATQAGIPNLVPGMTYAYTVAERNGHIVCRGRIKTEGRVRMLHCPSIFNVRDMGGWNTASGRTLRYEMLYRGSELRGNKCYATDEDVAALRSLGICAELDFRDEETASIQGGKSWLGEDCPYLFVSMNDTGTQYADNKEDFARAFRFVLDNLRNGRPTYIHCTYGADRTGMFCALLQGLAGVSLADIYKDFELTSFSTVAGLRQKVHLNRRLYNIQEAFPPTKNVYQLMTDYALNDLKLTQEEIDEFVALMTGNNDIPTAVNSQKIHGDKGVTGCYAPDGRRLKSPVSGLNLMRLSDGSIRKVIVR